MLAKPFRSLIGLISAVVLFVQPAFALPLAVGADAGTSYTHDALNRLTRLATRTAQNAVLADLGYAYDASGRRVRTSGQLPGVSGAVPFAVDYAYDPAGRLTGEERTQSAPYAILYAYDPSGNRVGMTRDGLKTLWESDAANRLVSVRQEGIPAQVDVLAEGTTDDPGATVTVEGVRAALDAGQTPPRWSATVSLAEGDHELDVVAVDALGNRQEVKRSVTVIDPTRRDFTYSAPGELTEEKRPWTGERTLYGYDSLSRLNQVSRVAAGSPAGTAPAELASYEYDGEGKRVAAAEGGVTTASLYDGLLPVLERQGSATTAVNVWGLSLGGGIGGLLMRHEPGATDPANRFLYPLYDGTGNVLAWTDEGGAVVSSTSYTAFGEVVTQTGAAQPYSYSTKVFSGATGLSHFGARHYRPDLGRWLTPDPLGQLDGPNVYGYVQNNPVNWIDPWGYKTKKAWWEDEFPSQEDYEEWLRQETLQPVPLLEDPTLIVLTGLKPRIPFKINVPGLSEPTHIGLDLWGKNIIHYGRSTKYLPGRHVALWFNEKGTALLHLYRDRFVISRGGKETVKYFFRRGR